MGVFTIPAPDERVEGWHVSPLVDLTSYAFSWAWVLFPMALLGDAKEDYLWWFIMILAITDVHRHYTIPYVYGDSQVRTQYPLRFILFPLALFALFVVSPWLAHQRMYASTAQVGAGVAFVVLLVQMLRRDGSQQAPDARTLGLAVVPTFGVAGLLTLAGLDPGGPLGPSTWWFAAALLGSTYLDVQLRRTETGRGEEGQAPRFVGPLLILGLVILVTLFGPGLDARTKHGGYLMLTVLNSVAAVAFAWNVWHVYAQKYGIMRMYNAKSGSDTKVAGWVDRMFVFAWLPLYLAWLGPLHEDVIRLWLRRGRHILDPMLAGLRSVAWFTVPIAVAFLVAAVVIWCVHEYRASKFTSIPRLTFAVGTFLLGSMFLLFDPVKAYLSFSFSHSLEYMVFVWAFQRRRYAHPLEHDPAMGRILRRPVLAYVGFTVGLGLVLIYWKYWGRHWGKAYENPTMFGYPTWEWVKYWTVCQSMMHFYWDGFLWKMRLKSVRANI